VTSFSSFFHVDDAVVSFVKPAEAGRSVVHGPESVADLLEGDDSVLEEAAHEDLAGLPPDGVVAGDQAELEVPGVLELGRVVSVRTRRRVVDRSRSLEVQRLVGSIFVVDPSELVEAELLSLEVRRGWRGRGFVEGAMEAFVAAVLLGARGFDELRLDAQLDPPDGELREPGDRGARERISVVGPDALGEPVLSEEVAETPDRCC